MNRRTFFTSAATLGALAVVPRKAEGMTVLVGGADVIKGKVYVTWEMVYIRMNGDNFVYSIDLCTSNNKPPDGVPYIAIPEGDYELEKTPCEMVPVRRHCDPIIDESHKYPGHSGTHKPIEMPERDRKYGNVIVLRRGDGERVGVINIRPGDSIT